jgi:FkbM family methyltransferase
MAILRHNCVQGSNVIAVARIKLKTILKVGLEWLLKTAPWPVTRLLVDLFPRLISVLPPGNSYRFDGFLGKFSVMIDPLYPIERQMSSGIYDRVTVRTIERFVRPGDVCLDIGANVGAITLALARASGRTGKVFALEPAPLIIERLRRNVALNQTLEGVVHIHQIGISDQSGFLKWEEDMKNRGNGSLFSEEGISVPVISLDEFCRENAIFQIRFIKIDVEGMEFEVFNGAKETLENLRPIILFESLAPTVEYRGFPVFQKIERLLTEYCYTLYKIDSDANLFETTSENLSENTLAIPIEVSRK